jgi:hypothetical protein
MCKFRKLQAHEIDVRVGQGISTTSWSGVSLLLYKNARVDMDILDEVVGSENWQRKHEVINGNLYCHVGIYSADKKEWVWKSDCGTESNTEKEKGEASDAFKRACVNWGIGRELYTAPKDMLVSCELNEKKQPKDKKLKFFVDTIEYDGNKISKLVIVNQNGEELYKYPKNGNVKPFPNQPKNTAKPNENAPLVKPITMSELIAEYGLETPQKTVAWLEGRYGKELRNFTAEETKSARAILDKKKAEREAEKREKGLRMIDDQDIPFSMGD